MKPDEEATANLRDDQSKRPEVAIIVLNWNNYEDTAECLTSLERIEYLNYRVIVVDNGSSDGSGEHLQDEFDWCEFVFSQENRGFAGGCNLGINRALNGTSDPDYILLLNNDIIVKPDFLTHLVSAAECGERVAGAGGVISDSSGEIWFAGGTFSRALCRGSHKKNVTSDRPYETEFITGAMVLLDVGFLEFIGGLNEDYFFGMEDVDLSLTAKDLGWKMMITPSATVTHNVSSSAGRRSPFKYYHATRNRLQLATVHLSIQRRLLFYILFSLSRTLRIAQWTFSGRFDLVRSVCYGIADYLTGASFKHPEAFDSR